MADLTLNISQYSPLQQFTVRPWETFSPDDQLVITDKINLIIQTLNRLGKLSNDVVTDWNKVMTWVSNDGMTAEVDSQLQKWKDDGTLTTLINAYTEIGNLASLQTTAKDSIVNAINENVNHFTDNANKTIQTSLEKLCEDMKNGLAVTIDCWGDSTYYGKQALVSGGRVATPAPLSLQNILRQFYKNTNIVVNNNGLNGNQTTNALRTWETNISSSVAQIIYINYGINDQAGANPTGVSDVAITAEQYRLNLIEMVRIVRKYGKIMILETPNPEHINDLIDNSVSMGQKRLLGIQQFAETMRWVAKYTNTPIVDNYQHVLNYMKSIPNLNTTIPDGIHPSQDVYIQKGRNMALPLIFPYVMGIKTNEVIPAGLVATIGDNVSINTAANGSAKNGLFYFSNTSIRILFFVESAGQDIYLGSTVWNQGSTLATINVDGTTYNTNFNEASLGSSTGFGSDQEILILENATQGLHILEIASTDTVVGNNIGFNYIRAYDTRKMDVRMKAYQGGSGGTLVFPSDMVSTYRKRVLNYFSFQTTSDSSIGNSQVTLEIPTSRLIKTLDVEMVATLNKGEGIALFSHTSSSGTNGYRHGGLYVFLNSTDGKINVTEGSGNNGFTTASILGTLAYDTVSHRYRVTVSTTGLVTVYVDGTQIGTYQMTKNYIGGFLGFYKFSNGTMRIDSVDIN